MNRNISMLILLALVVGAVLIGYNKWIMRDTYSLSQNASLQATGSEKTLESEALQKVVMEKPVPVAKTDKTEAAKSTPSVEKNGKQPAVTPVQSVQAATEKTLVLVKKTVTVAEVAEKQPAQSASLKSEPSKPKTVGSSEKQLKKEHVLLPLTSVSYGKKELTVRAKHAFTYKIFGLKQPDRFVVDIVGRFSEELPKPEVTQDAVVKAVRLGHHDDRVRIVLDLKGKFPANWSANQNKETLSVVFD